MGQVKTYPEIVHEANECSTPADFVRNYMDMVDYTKKSMHEIFDHMQVHEAPVESVDALLESMVNHGEYLLSLAKQRLSESVYL